MLKNFRYTIAAILAAVTLVAVPLAVPSLASAASIKSNLCSGSDLQISGGSCSSGAAGSLSKTITTIVDLLSVIVGAVAVIMIIIGGLRYVTSGGDANHTASAKNTILFAVVGLVVVALAQAIVQFVINKV